MIIYHWPAEFVASAEIFRLDARTGATGREQVVSAGLERWTKRLTVPELSADDLLKVRDFIGRLPRKRGRKS